MLNSVCHLIKEVKVLQGIIIICIKLATSGMNELILAWGGEGSDIS